MDRLDKLLNEIRAEGKDYEELIGEIKSDKEPTSTEKLIAYWIAESERMEEEVKQGNPNNRSLIELMRPKQMVYNLTAALKPDEFEHLKQANGSSTK